MRTENLHPGECFALCAPDGPSMPFGTPELIFIDAFRIVVMLLGVALIVWTPRLVLEAGAWGQKVRLFAQGVFALIVVGTEVDHLGDFAHYRLFLAFLGVAAMLVGTSRLRHEVPPKTISRYRKNA